MAAKTLESHCILGASHWSHQSHVFPPPHSRGLDEVDEVDKIDPAGRFWTRLTGLTRLTWGLDEVDKIDPAGQ